MRIATSLTRVFFFFFQVKFHFAPPTPPTHSFSLAFASTLFPSPPAMALLGLLGLLGLSRWRRASPLLGLLGSTLMLAARSSQSLSVRPSPDGFPVSHCRGEVLSAARMDAFENVCCAVRIAEQYRLKANAKPPPPAWSDATKLAYSTTVYTV